uniref:Integrase n=1 Tax=Heterorhabditis bacteriophora TaxID=37862 RepID=A0A1I7XLQ7_HETBA
MRQFLLNDHMSVRSIIDVTPIEGIDLQEDIRALETAVAERTSKIAEKKKERIDNDKASVVLSTLKNQVLEEEKKNQGRTFRLLDRDMELCIYMIERYGNDFKVG